MSTPHPLLADYRRELSDNYDYHRELSTDPANMFDAEDPQKRMTRTPLGHHYAGCVMAIQVAHRRQDFLNIPEDQRRKEQLHLAGHFSDKLTPEEHLRNVKKMAIKFKADTEGPNGPATLGGFPPINLSHFLAENMKIKQLILQKLNEGEGTGQEGKIRGQVVEMPKLDFTHEHLDALQDRMNKGMVGYPKRKGQSYAYSNKRPNTNPALTTRLTDELIVNKNTKQAFNPHHQLVGRMALAGFSVAQISARVKQAIRDAAPQKDNKANVDAANFGPQKVLDYLGHLNLYVNNQHLYENFDDWFNKSAEAAAAGQARLRDERNRIGTNHPSFDLSLKHPDTPGFGYQGGPKKTQPSEVTPPSSRSIHAYLIWSRDKHGRFHAEDYANAELGIEVAKQRFHEAVTSHVNRLYGPKIFTLTAMSGPNQGSPKDDRSFFMQHMKRVDQSHSVGGMPFTLKARSQGNMVEQEGYMPIDLVHHDTSNPYMHDIVSKTKDYEEARQYLGLGNHPSIDKFVL